MDISEGDCWNYWKYVTEIQIYGFVMRPLSLLKSALLPVASCIINVTKSDRICHNNGQTGGVRIHYQSNCKYIGSVYIVTVSNLVRSNAPKNLSTYEDHILAANRLFTWYLQPQHDNETKPLHHEDIHSLENSIFDEVYSSFNKSISVNETTINFPNTLDGFAPLLSIFGGSFKSLDATFSETTSKSGLKWENILLSDRDTVTENYCNCMFHVLSTNQLCPYISNSTNLTVFRVHYINYCKETIDWYKVLRVATEMDLIGTVTRIEQNYLENETWSPRNNNFNEVPILHVEKPIRRDTLTGTSTEKYVDIAISRQYYDTHKIRRLLS